MGDKPVIGFVGLGTMGGPIARNILRAGYQLVVHNRSRPKVDRLVDVGAEAGDSPQDVAEKAEIVFLCLPDVPTVETVMTGPQGIFHGMSAGKVIVDLSTSSATLARTLAAHAETMGVYVLDAPVSGGESGAVQGTLSIMVGGNKDAFERVLPVFRAIGETITYMGGPGSGQVTKSCNQVAVALTMQAVHESLLLAKKAGVDMTKVREVLLGGAAQSRALETHGQRIIDGDFLPGFRARLQQKDLNIALGTARAYGAPLLGTGLIHELFTALISTGGGDMDHRALFRTLDSLASDEVTREGKELR